MLLASVGLSVSTKTGRRVRFRPTLDDETPKVMEQLELAYRNSQRRQYQPAFAESLCDFVFPLYTPISGRKHQNVADALCCFFIKTGSTQESMCPLRNSSITTKPIIMNLSVNPRSIGKQTKIATSHLSKISCPPFSKWLKG